MESYKPHVDKSMIKHFFSLVLFLKTQHSTENIIKIFQIRFLKMIASSPVYLGICIQLIKLTGFAAEFKTTQILLFLESSRPEARTSSYSPCLCQYSQAQHLFYRIYAFLTIQDKNAFSKAISVSDTAFPPCP